MKARYGGDELPDGLPELSTMDDLSVLSTMRERSGERLDFLRAARAQFDALVAEFVATGVREAVARRTVADVRSEERGLGSGAIVRQLRLARERLEEIAGTA